LIAGSARHLQRSDDHLAAHDLPAVACRQRHEDVGQGRVWPEPRQQAVQAVAAGSTTPLAFDADDVQGKTRRAIVSRYAFSSAQTLGS